MVYKIQPEIFKFKTFARFNFAIKLKRVKILDFIISGSILYTKISRMVFFFRISLLTILFEVICGELILRRLNLVQFAPNLG